jgi:hypothetical protein
MWALAIRDFYTWLGHQFTGRDIDTTHTTFTNTIAVADTSVTGSPSAPETVAGSSSTPASGHKSTSPSAVVKYNLTKNEAAVAAAVAAADSNIRI